MRPLGNIGLNLLFEFHSGSPYTRIPSGSAFSEIYGFNAPAPLEAPYSSTLPWFYQLNGKLDKTFTIGPVRLNAYIWAINVLGTKSILANFRGQTGRPDSDGFLESELGKTYAKQRGEDWVNWYKAMLTDCGSYGWQEPRQIRFGLKLEI